MTPDDLLLRYPRETVRWLRRRLGLGQRGLGLLVGAESRSVAGWEAQQGSISSRYLARLMPLLARELATAEGAAFVQSLTEAAGERNEREA